MKDFNFKIMFHDCFQIDKNEQKVNVAKTSS